MSEFSCRETHRETAGLSLSWGSGKPPAQPVLGMVLPCTRTAASAAATACCVLGAGCSPSSASWAHWAPHAPKCSKCQLARSACERQMLCVSWPELELERAADLGSIFPSSLSILLVTCKWVVARLAYSPGIPLWLCLSSFVCSMRPKGSWFKELVYLLLGHIY